jgi:hypothetical protein
MGRTRTTMLCLAYLSCGTTALAQPDPDGRPSQPAQAPVVPAAHSGEISVIMGYALPIKGLNYKLGFGVRGGIDLGHFYLGGMVAIHQGDDKHISYGPSSLDNGGKQDYSSLAVFATVDAAYRLELPLGARRTTLSPFLSAGLLAIPMSSSGVYGATSITNTYLVLGGGASYSVDISDLYAVGLHVRVYDTGDTSFDFGDLSQNQHQHGFSTSIFYAAAYLESTFRF